MRLWQSWDWAFGQTPEFSHKLTHEFPWGMLVSPIRVVAAKAVHNRMLPQTAEVHSKHGVILSCTFALPESVDPELSRQLGELSERLKQQRYGFVDEGALGAGVRAGAVATVWNWLRERIGYNRTCN